MKYFIHLILLMAMLPSLALGGTRTVVADQLKNGLQTQTYTVPTATGTLITTAQEKSSNLVFEKNYILNPDAETDTSGWATYADAAGVAPVDGTGGSPASTFTRSTSSPLVQTASFVLAKSAANRQGEGFSYDFTIDSAFKGQQLKIDYLLEQVSGTFATGDMVVYVYDVTNGVMIQPSAYQVVSSTLPGPAQPLVFQSAYNSTSYRLIFHISTTSASAYSLRFDGFKVGPQGAASVGTVITPWEDWTPTGSISGNTTYTGKRRRVGDMLEVKVHIAYSAAPTTLTAGILINLPSGLTIDTNKLVTTQAYTTVPGIGTHTDIGVANHNVVFAYDTTTSVRALAVYTGTTPNQTQIQDISKTSPFTIGSGDMTDLFFTVPITGWGTNTVASENAATRAVTFKGTDGTGTLNGSFNTLSYTVAKDTHGMYSGGNITIKVPGDYLVSAGSALSGSATSNQGMTIGVYKNGSQTKLVNFDNQASGAVYASANTSGVLENLVAGDVLTIRVSTDFSTPSYLTGYNTVSVSMIQGPAQIQASTVVAFAAKDSSTSATTSAPFLFTTVTGNTHGAYSAATGKFTAPAPGYYFAQAKVYTSASVNAIMFYVNGSVVHQGLINNASNAPANIQELIYLNTGDTLEVRPTSSVTAAGGATLNSFSAFRVNAIQ